VALLTKASQTAADPKTKQMGLQQPFKLSEPVTQPYRWIGSMLHKTSESAPPPKWHLIRFSCFCRAHERD